MDLFNRIKGPLKAIAGKRIPKGVWTKCASCKEVIYQAELEKHLAVCPKCNHHHLLPAEERIKMLLAPGYIEHDSNLQATDPLKFRDLKKYKDRVKDGYKSTGRRDAVVSAEGKLGPISVQLVAFEFSFMGGSMGSVVGEKITRAAERSLGKRQPLIIVSCSGGARMQEGILSLMQMAKTAAALESLSNAGIPYISVLTNPVTGGVTASFAMLGDIIIAEPGALIGFAGPRVIQQTIRQELPAGFQTSEFLMEHGFVDIIVHRAELKAKLIQLAGLLTNQSAPKPA